MPATEVRAPSLKREVLQLLPWLAAVAVLWTAGVFAQRARAPRPEDAFAAWQRSYLELPAPEQRLYRQLREGILEAENARAATGAWPEPSSLAADGVPPFAQDALAPALRWTKRQHGVYVNYAGVPVSGSGQRWLVLFIEPEPGLLRGANEPPPPVDEEHHTLPNGLALHVTVWTTAEPKAVDEVLAFPVAEGWTQRLGR